MGCAFLSHLIILQNTVFYAPPPALTAFIIAYISGGALTKRLLYAMAFWYSLMSIRVMALPSKRYSQCFANLGFLPTPVVP
jgi:hypothetical protein